MDGPVGILRRALLVAALACVTLVALLRVREPDGFIAGAFSGSTVVHLSAYRRGRERLAVLGLALLLLITWTIATPPPNGEWARLSMFGVFLGISSLIVLALPTIWEEGAARRARLEVALIAAGIPLAVSLAVPALALTVVLRPVVWDPVLYALDASFGGQVPFALGRLLRDAPALDGLARLAYKGTALGVCVGYVATGPVRGTRLLLACFGVMLGGLLMYPLIPACGPVYHFPAEFPNFVPTAAGYPVPRLLELPCPRNAMPSVHMALALVLCWFSRGQPVWARWGWAIFAGLTAIAALGLGEHYVVDLVVAVPFGLAVYAAADGRSAPWIVACSAAITAAWLLVIRLAATSAITASRPGIYIASISTLVGCWWLIHAGCRVKPLVKSGCELRLRGQ